MRLAARRLRAAAALLASVAAPSQAAADPTLAIEARLFGSKTGKLSENVLASPGVLLGNVIIGDDASTSTFVTVLVSSDQPLSGRARVRLVASELTSKSGRAKPGRLVRKVLDSSAFVGSLAGDGKPVHVGFWLSYTGCAPIALKAELLAPPARRVSSAATLDFACYE